MSATGKLFVAGLWAVGVVCGLVIARAPHLLPIPVPALIGPLAVSFVADLAMAPAAASGRIAPLTMNERFTGVVGAALIAMGVSAALGAT